LEVSRIQHEVRMSPWEILKVVMDMTDRKVFLSHPSGMHRSKLIVDFPCFNAYTAAIHTLNEWEFARELSKCIPYEGVNCSNYLLSVPRDKRSQVAARVGALARYVERVDSSLITTWTTSSHSVTEQRMVSGIAVKEEDLVTAIQLCSGTSPFQGCISTSSWEELAAQCGSSTVVAILKSFFVSLEEFAIHIEELSTPAVPALTAQQIKEIATVEAWQQLSSEMYSLESCDVRTVSCVLFLACRAFICKMQGETRIVKSENYRSIKSWERIGFPEGRMQSVPVVISDLLTEVQADTITFERVQHYYKVFLEAFRSNLARTHVVSAEGAGQSAAAVVAPEPSAPAPKDEKGVDFKPCTKRQVFNYINYGFDKEELLLSLVRAYTTFQEAIPDDDETTLKEWAPVFNKIILYLQHSTHHTFSEKEVGFMKFLLGE